MSRLRRDVRHERGASVIEFTLLMPVLVFIVFAVIQFAMYFFARHVAVAAAQAGSRTARTEAATTAGWQGDARAKAQSYVDQLAPRLLESVRVTATGPDNDVVGVRITAAFPKILPFIPDVSVRAEGPIERFVGDN